MNGTKQTLNDIEKEMSGEERDAVKDEQKCADRVFGKIDAEYLYAKNGKAVFLCMIQSVAMIMKLFRHEEENI